MSQANPNSPQPPPPSCTTQGKFGGPGTSTGSYVWSGSDNTGWVLTGSNCATSPEPPTVCPSSSDTGEDGSSPGSYSWNGSTWAGYGPTCTDASADAAQAAAAQAAAQQAAAQQASALVAANNAAAQQAATQQAATPVLKSYSCSGYGGNGAGKGAGTLYPVCSTSLSAADAFTGNPVSSVLYNPYNPGTPGNILQPATSTTEGSTNMYFDGLPSGSTLTFTCYTPKTGYCAYSGSPTVPAS